MLINQEGLESLVQSAYNANYKRGEPLILVSATPVFGFELADQVQVFLASKSNIYKWDLETWSSNEKGFIRFLTFLLTFTASNHCIILSGDVHYGFTQRTTFDLLQKNIEKNEQSRQYQTLLITQLTSSALKTTSLAKDLAVNQLL